MLRIVSWNVAGRDVWDLLDDADVALLQECPRPPADWSDRVAPDPSGEWRTAGWEPSGAWARRTAIAAPSGRVLLRPWRLTDLEELRPTDAIPVSRHGTLAAADVDLDDGPVTLVSLYAGWQATVDGRALLHADAAAHRLLSDLSVLIGAADGHRIIAAGDLNILHRHGERGDPYWGGRYASVFDRAEALGLVLAGPFAPDGRVADPRPAELPEGARDVPTFHTPAQGPAGAQRQLDFVLVSRTLADRFTVRARNGVDEWGPSDHCRVEIELG